MGQFGFLRHDTGSCEYACWSVGCRIVGGEYVMADSVMDDPGRASSGVPHTITKGAASSVGFNEEIAEM